MNSTVMKKFVLIEKNNICFCDKDCFKTCPERIKNNLDCTEMIVRFTPVERGESLTKDFTDDFGSLDTRLRNVPNSFKRTLNHFNKIK